LARRAQLEAMAYRKLVASNKDKYNVDWHDGESEYFYSLTRDNLKDLYEATGREYEEPDYMKSFEARHMPPAETSSNTVRPPSPSTNQPQPGTPGNEGGEGAGKKEPIQVKSKEDWDKLPDGAEYLTPSGTRMV